MTVAELCDLLTSYPDDMEVVLFRPEREGYDEYYEPDFYTEVNDENQLVID